MVGNYLKGSRLATHYWTNYRSTIFSTTLKKIERTALQKTRRCLRMPIIPFMCRHGQAGKMGRFLKTCWMRWLRGSAT